MGPECPSKNRMSEEAVERIGIGAIAAGLDHRDGLACSSPRRAPKRRRAETICSRELLRAIAENGRLLTERARMHRPAGARIRVELKRELGLHDLDVGRGQGRRLIGVHLPRPAQRLRRLASLRDRRQLLAMRGGRAASLLIVGWLSGRCARLRADRNGRRHQLREERLPPDSPPSAASFAAFLRNDCERRDPYVKPSIYLPEVKLDVQNSPARSASCRPTDPNHLLLLVEAASSCSIETLFPA